MITYFLNSPMVKLLFYCHIFIYREKVTSYEKYSYNWNPNSLENCSVSMLLMDIMMMNCFYGMVAWQIAFSFISSRNQCQRSSRSQISDTPRVGFEPAERLSSDFLGRICAVVITTAPRHHWKIVEFPEILIKWKTHKHFMGPKQRAP